MCPERPNEEDGMKTHLAKFAAVLLTTAALGAGWMYASGQYYGNDRYNDNDRYGDRYNERGRWSRNMTVRAGTPIDVRLDTRLATDDNNVGDSWTGVVARDVLNPNGRRVMIPAGPAV